MEMININKNMKDFTEDDTKNLNKSHDGLRKAFELLMKNGGHAVISARANSGGFNTISMTERLSLAESLGLVHEHIIIEEKTVEEIEKHVMEGTGLNNKDENIQRYIG